MLTQVERRCWTLQLRNYIYKPSNWNYLVTLVRYVTLVVHFAALHDHDSPQRPGRGAGMTVTLFRLHLGWSQVRPVRLLVWRG